MENFVYKDIDSEFLDEYEGYSLKVNSLDYSKDEVLSDFFKNEDFLMSLKNILAFNIGYRYTNNAFELASQSSDMGSREAWFRNRVLAVLKETGYFSTFYIEEQLDIFLKDFSLDRLYTTMNVPKGTDTEDYAKQVYEGAKTLLGLMQHLNSGSNENTYKFKKAVNLKTFKVYEI